MEEETQLHTLSLIVQCCCSSHYYCPLAAHFLLSIGSTFMLVLASIDS